MTFDEERKFLEPWGQQAKDGGILVVSVIRAALVTDRPKGATDDRVNGATQSGSFSLLDGVNYWSFFALFSFVVFVPWGQFFGER